MPQKINKLNLQRLPERQRDSNLSPLKEHSRMSNAKSVNLGSGSRVMRRVRVTHEKFLSGDI
jgi:hypothetical protein